PSMPATMMATFTTISLPSEDSAGSTRRRTCCAVCNCDPPALRAALFTSLGSSVEPVTDSTTLQMNSTSSRSTRPLAAATATAEANKAAPSMSVELEGSWLWWSRIVGCHVALQLPHSTYSSPSPTGNNGIQYT